MPPFRFPPHFRFAFRLTVLSAGAALALTACDNRHDKTQENASTESDSRAEYALAAANSAMDEAPIKTLSGSFLSGQFAQNHADWSEAAADFQHLLDAPSASGDLQRRVMALNMGSGNYAAAVDLASKMVADKNPTGDTTLAHMILSIDSFKAGKYTAAAAEIENCKNDGLGVAVVPILRAWADVAQGKVKLETWGFSPSMLYQTVYLAAFAKDKIVLKKIAETIDFTKTPTPIGRLEEIAEIYAANGLTDPAVKLYTTLADAVLDRRDSYLSKIKDIQKGTYRATAPKDIATPQTALSAALLDMARVLSTDYQDSARLFAHMSLFLVPENRETLGLIADIAAQNGLYADAIETLAKIDTADNPELRIAVTRQTAQLLVKSGKSDEAVRILNDLANKDDNLDAQIQIGDIYRNDNKFDAALKAYNRAYDMLGGKITAGYWDLSFARGMVNERLGNWSQAEKDLLKTLELEPNQPYVLNYLGYSWADKGVHLDKAAGMIEKAVKLKPDDGAIVDSLGWVYFRTGRFADAVKLLERAVEIQPTEAEINDHLGDAYWRVGRKSEARFQWKRSLNFTKAETDTSRLQDKIDNGLPPLAENPAPVKKTTP